MHLVDVNVWLALAFQRTVRHSSAAAWFNSTNQPCYFCRLTQLAFLRLATNPAAMGPAAVGMSEAWSAYDALVADPRVQLIEEPTGIEAALRQLTRGQKFSTNLWNDAYLAAMAEVGGYEIVTFDRGFAQFMQVKSTILT